MVENDMAKGHPKGFSLLETMIALVVLLIGVLALAAMLGTSLMYMNNSQNDFIAQQKTEEALEAIFTAKYDNRVTFSQINNTSATPVAGIFLTGAQPILQPGPDGLVGTSADTGATPAYLYLPGPDGILGTADDLVTPLSNFTRTITINAVNGDANLRQIIVSVSYTAGTTSRTYSMTSYISAFN
jgi:prepilin-type N-terminal cleavage/methylation domain-containing protein